jgi:hypothetical protein
MVLKRDAEGTVKCVENAKVAVYAQVRVRLRVGGSSA